MAIIRTPGAIVATSRWTRNRLDASRMVVNGGAIDPQRHTAMILRLFCASLFAYVAAFPALAQEAPVNWDERATALFEAIYPGSCDTIEYPDVGPRARTEKFEFKQVSAEEEEAGPPKRIVVYRFLCSYGAYYEEHVYFRWREPTGLEPLLFAKPTFNAGFEIDNDPASKLLSIDVTGFTSQTKMINSEVDVLTGTITEDAKWGGTGEAGSHGIWFLDGGDYRLGRFDIDPSRDGNENLVTVLQYPDQ